MQSTVLCLLAERGAFGDKPDCAIFADTRWEPRGVYDTLEWLRREVSFEIRVVSNGRSLREDVRNGVNVQGQPWVTIPVYLEDRNGGGRGINWRQCTKNYKLDPIYREVSELLGARPRQHLAPGTYVEMWLGITTDEAMRMKRGRNWWVRQRYPLIEDRPMSRADCEAWFAAEYPGRTLTRSACVGCPFRGAASWVDVSRSDPDAFEEAIEIDAGLREGSHTGNRLFRKRAFLHHRRIPLREAVERDREVASSGDDGFGNECEGHCGL